MAASSYHRSRKRAPGKIERHGKQSPPGGSRKSLLAAGLAALVPGGSALAGVIATTGSAQVVAAPADATIGHFESNSAVQVFTERQSFTLPQAVAVDITQPGTAPQPPDVNLSLGTVAAGTVVNSYYMHFDPVGSHPDTKTGSVTFGEPVLGLIVGVKDGTNVDAAGNSLDVSNAILGTPGTLYGFEPLDLYNFTDSVTLSADRRTVSFDWGTDLSDDNMRVVTTVPEPTALGLVSPIGLLVLRRRAGHGHGSVRA